MNRQIMLNIEKTLKRNGRNSKNCTLVAVSKTRTFAEINQLYQSGITQFGENYVQEGLEKINAARAQDINDLTWHMIGPVQSNKAKTVAQSFDWIQSLSSEKLAVLLNKHRPDDKAKLQVCLQINIDQAPSKNGLAPSVETLLAFIQRLTPLESLQLRGFMVMPDAATEQQTLALFTQAKILFDAVKAAMPAELAEKFDTLSMGMSGDYLHAIEAGSTMVRIGTALFGARQAQEKPIKRG